MVKEVDLTLKSTKNYKNIIQRLRGRVEHSIMRAEERYGVKMTEYDYFQMIDQIVSHQAIYLRPSRVPGSYQYKVFFNGVPMLAIYETKYAQISTFLAWGMI